MIQLKTCHSALISDVKEHFRWKEGEVVSDNTAVCSDNSYQMTSPHLPGHAYFRRMLNSTTVELHTAVNQYDAQLEGKTTIKGAKEARKKLYELLQQVSLGVINPIQGLEAFLVALTQKDGILDQIKSGYVKKSTPTSPASMRKIIHDYVVRASLSALNDDGFHLKRSYVASLLFMNKEHRVFIMGSECSAEALADKAEQYFLDLQNAVISN